MRGLYETLREYASLGVYPFHMPGHKRRDLGFGDPFSIDITEIEGFDNLHHAEGILKEAQERAAALAPDDLAPRRADWPPLREAGRAGFW